jgi:hypothetical protein
MTDPIREVATTNIVLLGAFNPAIFQPAWFARQGLLPGDEAEGAEIALIHPEFVSFTAGWLQLQVTQSQFLASASEDPLEALRDLVMGTFSLLRHTPVSKMGINRDAHVRMPDESSWHRVGHTLVPRDRWAFLREPGLRSLVEEGVRPDDYLGYIRVKVEPSNLVQPGVYMQVNDHYQWSVEPGDTAVESVLDVLKNGWEASLERAEMFIDSIIEVGGIGQ